MKDKIWQRDEPESPCVQVCVIHPQTRLCVGCHRSIDEISAWAGMSRDARLAVLEMLPQRAGAKPKRRGGRARNAKQ